jgi:hypothetical protein
MKPDSAILLKQHPFVIPEFSEDIHHEIEIIIKINKVGKYIEPKFAHKYEEISVGSISLGFTNQAKSERVTLGKSQSI